MLIHYKYREEGDPGFEGQSSVNLDSNRWSLQWVADFLRDQNPDATIISFTVEVNP